MATSAKSWQKVKGEDLELPSGNVAKVHRPGPTALLKKGVLPDAMAKMVNDMIKTGKGMKKDDISAAIGNDPEALFAMVDSMDRILCTVVLEPKVLYHRREVKDENGQVRVNSKGEPDWEDIPEDERDTETAIYTDEVDFDDKQFLFNFAVGGTRDLARFRREANLSMGNVSDGEDDEQSAVGTSGD